MSEVELPDSFEEIQRAGKVVPYNIVKKMLQQTEPIESHILSTEGASDVETHFPDEWNFELKYLDDSNITAASIVFGDHSKRYFFTKRAAITLMNKIGLSESYAKKVPGHLVQPQVDYWFKNRGVGPSTQTKLLTKDSYVVAVMEPSIPVVSNLEVLDRIKVYLSKAGVPQIFCAPDITNNFVETDFKIVLPEVALEVPTVRDGESVVDKWHFGFRVSNSLSAYFSNKLSISGFMFEEGTQTGILPEYSQTSSFVKSLQMDIDDVRGWVDSMMAQIMAILPTEAEMVQAMPNHILKGKIGIVSSDLFKSWKIPKKAQEACLENLKIGGDMTAYGLMMALGHSVTNPASMGLTNRHVAHVQKVSGSLLARAEQICDSCGRMHLQD